MRRRDEQRPDRPTKHPWTCHCLQLCSNPATPFPACGGSQLHVAVSGSRRSVCTTQHMPCEAVSGRRWQAAAHRGLRVAIWTASSRASKVRCRRLIVRGLRRLCEELHVNEDLTADGKQWTTDGVAPTGKATLTVLASTLLSVNPGSNQFGILAGAQHNLSAASAQQLGHRCPVVARVRNTEDADLHAFWQEPAHHLQHGHERTMWQAVAQSCSHQKNGACMAHSERSGAFGSNPVGAPGCCTDHIPHVPGRIAGVHQRREGELLARQVERESDVQRVLGGRGVKELGNQVNQGIQAGDGATR